MTTARAPRTAVLLAVGGLAGFALAVALTVAGVLFVSAHSVADNVVGLIVWAVFTLSVLSMLVGGAWLLADLWRRTRR